MKKLVFTLNMPYVSDNRVDVVSKTITLDITDGLEKAIAGRKEGENSEYMMAFAELFEDSKLIASTKGFDDDAE